MPLLIDDVLQDVKNEFLTARSKHKRFSNAHEGYAVILEELEELWEHVKKDTAYTEDARKEAVQVAATAVKFVQLIYDKNQEERRHKEYKHE